MTSSPPVLPDLPARYRPWPSPERALLGQGGAATVWRVQDQDLGVLVALKVLKTTSSRMVARLEREAILASRVVHANVVPLHDIGQTPDGQAYLAFGLASDGTLLDLSGDPPPWPILQRLISQTLSALGALHARNILHLDVKMSNLLLHRRGPSLSVWLADLGVARALFDEDEENRIFGTVSYMPAERLRGQYHLWGPQADLFSLGVMLFRLLTGHLPFPSLDPREALSQRKQPPIGLRIRPGYAVPQGLEQVILPLLQYHHADRFDLAADVIRSLESLPPLTEPPTESLEPILDPEDSGRGSAPPWPRPRPTAPPDEAIEEPPQRRIPQAPSLVVHRELALVHRSDEQTALWRACRETISCRRPQLVELTGPRGVGRSRLVSDLLHRLEEGGWAEGVRMDFGERAGPGLGLRGCWRRLLPAGGKPEQRLEQVARFIGRNRRRSTEECLSDARALLAWLEPTAESTSTDPRIARSLLVEHLVARSWRGMTWLCLEDLHLAQENDDCWAVVDEVLAQPAPIMVLSSTARGHASPSILEMSLRNPQDQHRIEIEPLAADEARGLVAELLPLDPALESKLVTHTGGNPGQIRNLMVHWVRSGALRETHKPGSGVRTWSLGEPSQFPTDNHHFAQLRLSQLGDDSEAMRALQALTLAGTGCPLAVLEEVAAEGLDRLRIEGMVEVRGQGIRMVPEELGPVAEASLQEQERRDIHAQLAEAWTGEGDGPMTLARVGTHRFHSGQLEEALTPLFRALHLGRDRFSVQQAEEVARLTYRAAEALGDRASRAWQLAAMVMAQSQWRSGKTSRARHIDEVLSSRTVDARLSLRAWSERLHRTRIDDPRIPEQLERLAESLPSLSLPERSRLLVARARVRIDQLDRWGTHSDLLDAMASRPHPAVECRAHLLRVRLLDAVDPMSAWHEALRCIEMARSHGLLGAEVLAWGLAGLHMSRLGHGEEALVRVVAGIGRLEAHGDLRTAHEARLHQGRILAELGRHEEAMALWSREQDIVPGEATLAMRGRELQALHSLFRGQIERTSQLATPNMPTPAIRQTWSMIRACISLRQGALPMLPGPEALERTAAVGRYGIATGLLLSRTLDAQGHRGHAQLIRDRIEKSCRSRALSMKAVTQWLDRASA